MPMELTACEQFIRTQCTVRSPIAAQLVAAVPGGFHSERQHAALAGRYVLWTKAGGKPDTTGELGIRILSRPLYLVRVVDKVGSFLSLETAADYLDQALHQAPPMAVVLNGKNYTIQSCIRTQGYSLTEHLVDLEWRHLGGYYEISVSPY